MESYLIEVENEGGGEVAVIKVEHGEGMPNLIAGMLLTLGVNRGEINFHRGRVWGNVQPLEEEGIGAQALTCVYVKVYFSPFH